MNISSILLSYRSDEYIESTIVLTILRNVSMNGTELECGITGLSSETTNVLVTTSGMTEIYA